jgi:hypothetical protein
MTPDANLSDEDWHVQCSSRVQDFNQTASTIVSLCLEVKNAFMCMMNSDRQIYIIRVNYVTFNAGLPSIDTSFGRFSLIRPSASSTLGLRTWDGTTGFGASAREA